MANALDVGAAWLGRQLGQTAGRAVFLTPNPTSGLRLSLTAILVNEEYEDLDDNGFMTKRASSDWTFTVAELNGVVIGEGAYIEAEIGGAMQYYVAAPIGKRPHAEKLDAAGVLLIVHSNRIPKCPYMH